MEGKGHGERRRNQSASIKPEQLSLNAMPVTSLACSMALVDYDSEEELVASSNPTEPRSASPRVPDTKKRKVGHAEHTSDLPPLPAKFHDLYASSTRISTRDDPALHGGRQRSTPHIEGNWPTHVYIEWFPSTTEYNQLTNLIVALTPTKPMTEEIHSLLSSDLGVAAPLHVSLSQPIGFLTEQKDAFLESVAGIVTSSGIRPFDLRFSSLKWAPNSSRTRYFLVLHLQRPAGNALNRLLHTCNSVVQSYAQPPLYVSTFRPSVEKAAPPKRNRQGLQKQMVDWSHMQDVDTAFHVSIAWTLKAPSEALRARTERMEHEHWGAVEPMRISTTEVKVKIGNVVNNVELPKLVREGKGLFGG